MKGISTRTEKNRRITKTRRLLLEVLQETSRPQSVPELQKLLAKKRYTPHKTTLYREIEQLLLEGVLAKVQLSENRISYELSGEHHHHFVCESCFRVTELYACEELMKKVKAALAADGKQVTHHTFEFFGVCENCFTS